MDRGFPAGLHLVACGHGTRSAVGRRTVDALVRVLDRKVRQKVHGASVDVQRPEVGEVVAGLPFDRHGVLVPLLLSTGFHTRVDLRNAAARFGEGASGRPTSGEPRMHVARPLGPSPMLARLQARRLDEAGWRPGDGIVMGVVGSSVAEGTQDAQLQRKHLEALLGTTVHVGFGTAARPTIAEAVKNCRREGSSRVFVSSYILAPGTFQDRLRQAEADGVAGTLLSIDDPLSLELVADVGLSRAAECAPGTFHDEQTVV